jgi:hypothetical protein
MVLINFFININSELILFSCNENTNIQELKTLIETKTENSLERPFIYLKKQDGIYLQNDKDLKDNNINNEDTLYLEYMDDFKENINDNFDKFKCGKIFFI